jgi:hypothetical protein
MELQLPVCAYTSFMHHTLKRFRSYSHHLQKLVDSTEELEDSTEEMNYFGSNLLSYLAIQTKIQIEENYLEIFQRDFLHNVDVYTLYRSEDFRNKDPKNDYRFYQGELCPLNYRGPCDHCGEWDAFSSFIIQKNIKVNFLWDPESNKKFEYYIKEGTELRRWANYCSATCAGVSSGYTDRTAKHFRDHRTRCIFDDANSKLDVLCKL